METNVRLRDLALARRLDEMYDGESDEAVEEFQLLKVACKALFARADDVDVVADSNDCGALLYKGAARLVSRRFGVNYFALVHCGEGPVTFWYVVNERVERIECEADVRVDSLGDLEGDRCSDMRRDLLAFLETTPFEFQRAFVFCTGQLSRELAASGLRGTKRRALFSSLFTNYAGVTFVPFSADHKARLFEMDEGLVLSLEQQALSAERGRDVLVLGLEDTRARVGSEYGARSSGAVAQCIASLPKAPREVVLQTRFKQLFRARPGLARALDSRPLALAVSRRHGCQILETFIGVLCIARMIACLVVLVWLVFHALPILIQ